MKILIDTNFFLALKYVDIFRLMRQHGSIATVSSCVKELERISKSKKKDAATARIALDLIKKRKIKVIRTNQPADTALVDYAKRHNYAVATNDKKLIKRLENNGIKDVRLRQKRYVAV